MREIQLGTKTILQETLEQPSISNRSEIVEAIYRRNYSYINDSNKRI
jgi:hypothetical protein